MIQKIYSKLHCNSCANTHYDVATFEADGIVMNISKIEYLKNRMAFPKLWLKYYIFLEVINFYWG